MKLTTKLVEAIEADDNRQEIADALLPGLYLIVQPSGVKSWAVRYRHQGQPKKYTIPGRYPAISLKDARDLGAKALRAVAEGRDPSGEKKVQGARGATIEDIIAQFLDRYCRRNQNPRTAAKSKWLLERHILPYWKDRPVDQITRADVRAVLDRQVDRAPVLANRVYTITRKMFGWAVSQDIIANSPFEGLEAPAKEKSRDRILTDEELCKVWRATGKTNVDPVYRAMIRMLILTGQRRSEVAGLTWDEIDLKTRQWTLPATRTKNGRAHIVPLSDRAITALNAVPRLHERHVFSANGKHAIGGFSQPKDRLNEVCGFSDWTVHDLRRTVASGMARLGINLPVIEKVLNHVSGSFAGVAGIYQRHDFAAEKRAALDAWSNHIAAIAAGKAAKVVSLR